MVNKILSSIENHHAHENVDKLSLFEHMVLFADKMDFSHTRLDYEYINKQNNKECYVESYITNINFNVVNNKFVVIIKIKNSDALIKVKSWNMYKKILNIIEAFANKIDMSYEVNFVYNKD